MFMNNVKDFVFLTGVKEVVMGLMNKIVVLVKWMVYTPPLKMASSK